MVTTHLDQVVESEAPRSSILANESAMSTGDSDLAGTVVEPNSTFDDEPKGKEPEWDTNVWASGWVSVVSLHRSTYADGVIDGDVDDDNDDDDDSSDDGGSSDNDHEREQIDEILEYFD